MKDINYSEYQKFKEFLEENTLLACCYMEKAREMPKWRDTIPYISWPADMEVQFFVAHIPLLRGSVRLKENHDRRVSFFLDGYNSLGGAFGQGFEPIPYWEILDISKDIPVESNSDIARFDMNNIEGFLEGIRKMLYGEPLDGD